MHPFDIVDSFRSIKHSSAKFFNYRFLYLTAMSLGMYGCSLRYGRGGKNHIFIYLLDYIDKRLRCDYIAYAPPCHNKVL